MNKAKLIEELNGWLLEQCEPEYAGNLRMTLVNAKVTLERTCELLEQLDEPKKVIVPVCAEPWLEKAQYSSDVISLFSEVEYATDSDGFIKEKWTWTGEFYDWLANDSDTLYILSDALRYGYEIEKEPLYEVVFMADEDGRYLLMQLGEDSFEIVHETENDGYRSQWFTQERIKAIDDRFWTFAVPTEGEE